ncbi:M48 family metalloprotease [Sphingomonas sp. CL5.1]|uniref:M48 family metallopeptidase n=1 Tax=Sphingomonas sp. CL5.1 TaxID=2653203 RepID=UPI0015816E32|nr:M48 family metallopeptidase [Sphingomonas sp. CL5.1]QKR99946.1 M48 family metalloprotease [Sphingomonas sp. CL5.1]
MSKFRIAAALFPLALTAAAPAGLSVESLEALRAIDLRLGTIGYRLATANAALCERQAPATGALLHAITQYDRASEAAARQAFGFAAPVAVEAVVGDSPAARAGLEANDGVLSVNGEETRGSATPPSVADRDAALAAIARGGMRVRLDTIRDGARRAVDIAGVAGCDTTFEVVLGPEMTAQSDGKVVQIGVRFLERYRDDEVAVVAAHELAHVILNHRARLEAAGVKGGLFGEFGRNARLTQRAEEEADRLGVHLLYNAGYDPASAARFWRAHGGDVDGGFFRSRTHPATKVRVAAIEAEAATLAAEPARPSIPPMVAERDRPMR